MKWKIRQTRQFRKDLKRISKSGRYNLAKFWNVVAQLRDGQELSPSQRNHKLHGDLAGHEECHIQGDWVLIYKKEKDLLILTLTRTGTHAELFE